MVVTNTAQQRRLHAVPAFARTLGPASTQRTPTGVRAMPPPQGRLRPPAARVRALPKGPDRAQVRLSRRRQGPSAAVDLPAQQPRAHVHVAVVAGTAACTPAARRQSRGCAAGAPKTAPRVWKRPSPRQQRPEAQRRLMSMPGAAEGHISSAQQPRDAPSFSLRDFDPPAAAINVIRNIPDRASSYYLFETYRNIHDAWCRLAARWLLHSLWDTFGDILEGDRSDESLSVMAKKLCLNTASVLREDHTNPKEWFKEFSGQNMRWECIGILYAYWSSGLLSLPRETFKGSCKALHDMDRRTALDFYKDLVADCANLCWNAGNGNTLLCFLLFERSLLQSNISGDGDLRHFRLHGDLIALTTYLGLHTSSAAFGDRSVSVQIRRRLFAGIFNIDKLIAIFTGRPPLLTRRFISESEPLDISDEELLQVPPGPGAAYAGIDSGGWSLGNKILPVSPLRARTMMAYTRDSILEIALRNNNKLMACEDALLELRQQATSVYDGFPSILKHAADDLQNPDLDHVQVYTRLHITLEHLHNVFFIERLLSKLREGVTAELVRISLEIIELSLIPFTNRQLTTGVMCDIDWLLMAYGAPAGGVLCMELLRPAAASSGAAGVKKSTMIRSLSMLVGCLHAVPSDAPNYGVSATLKKIIEQVLDRVLDPPAETTGQEFSVQGWETDFLVDAADLFTSDLLDTFDWFRP
ncbi:hypothetical protein BBAD15_g8450 [Beauveria bassiana D1-5]|uniref:Xylanolytic transcriptional activator regulatory domain-containing protein n=1 Tax=Beauveria bassiana D1-5 TaxID=1245745 RepID=A0A0A2VJC9_BEABA|nr:hypothetical protein BBAD15_g8450 [Beauveria bassiana D1-5]